MTVEIWVSLPERFRLAVDDGDVRLVTSGGELPMPALPAGVARALCALEDSRVTEDELAAQVLAGAGPAGVLPLYAALEGLRGVGALRSTLAHDGQPLATLTPLSPPAPALPVPGRGRDRLTPYVLSRFAAIHADGGDLVLDSPTGAARVVLHDPGAVAAIGRLAAPATVGDLVSDGDLPDEDVAAALVSLCQAAGAVVDATEATERFDAPDAPVGWWERHDLLFHARSRLGRHVGGYGGTFHRKGLVPAPQTVRADRAAILPLPRPDLERLRREDPPFADVLERRRSVRDYGPPPTLSQLGEFLFRAARVQHEIPPTAEDPDYSLRPHPAGGALHELVLYPVVASCDGLAAGVYRYDPYEHGLVAVAAAGGSADELLDLAWRTADHRSVPQVYFAITARFQRLQWKYESMVYSVVLKDVGALYQTMYLVATAMGLAPCALGGGSSDLFSRLAGLDYYAESQVGEFLLGTRPETH
jgi:SagB-type dehydrogenase family enzyme